MPHYAYIAIQEDDKIATFTVSPGDGSLSHVRDLEVSGGPFTMAVSPDGNHLYVGCRGGSPAHQLRHRPGPTVSSPGPE